MTDAVRRVSVVRMRAGPAAAAEDAAAVEEPLEVRLQGQPFAVIMRTPGADRELAAGFLLSEGVIGAGDRPKMAEGENLIDVTLTGTAAEGVERQLQQRRNVVANSSCGVCGRLTVDSLRAGIAPITSTFRVSRQVIQGLPDTLRAAQAVFDQTGGLHAAALFGADGTLETSAEDVGRHNAVDKVVGRMLLAGRLPIADRLLFVSGRTSFEIVQKAAMAGVPLVAAVSAPSTLAIDLARDTGVTLLGFVRGDAFNIYTHPQRVTES
jgi:FdhD protein